MRYSVGTEAAYLVFALIIGVLAYFAAERFKRSHGVTPWRWPAAAWGIIGFLSLLLCVVLFLIAQRTTRLPSVSGHGPRRTGGGAAARLVPRSERAVRTALLGRLRLDGAGGHRRDGHE